MDRSGAFPRETSTLDRELGVRGKRAGREGMGGSLVPSKGLGVGQGTAASSVTYTSILKRISSPPPVAKTTCQLSRRGSSGREGEGDGCDSYCLLFGDRGRGPQCWGGGEGASRAPPLSPSLSFYKALGLAPRRPQENLNSGPDNRPVLGRRRHWAASQWRKHSVELGRTVGTKGGIKLLLKGQRQLLAGRKAPWVWLGLGTQAKGGSRRLLVPPLHFL